MWKELVEQKEKFIGGVLEEFPDTFTKGATTKITDMKFEKNQYGDMEFIVEGEDFTESFCIELGGIVGGEKGWLTFSVHYCPGFRIKEKAC